jgi:MFS family permease
VRKPAEHGRRTQADGEQRSGGGHLDGRHPGSGHLNAARPGGGGGRYKWIALSNTTLSMTMATIDASIVIISMPAIFRGIHLNPLSPGNISYLLWMIIGYLLVQAVLVVTLGRLGDMFGRVRIYNLGFVVFTIASIALSLDPLLGGGGALWLITWRIMQAFGGSMLMANSAAILTDAFPAGQRGMALGINQIAGISGQFVGLLLGGVLAAWDWRAVFWVNVPIGVFGTVWAYLSLREVAATRRRARIDWPGNITFALGAGLLLVAITYGIQPYGGHPTGWTNPWVLGGLAIGIVLLAAFCFIETKIAEPMFRMSLFRIRAFAAGNLASLLGAIARGGLQFMLVIWLAGIWLPLHGYNYVDTPLWAGIYMLPLTAGFLIAGPISGYLSDRYGQRLFATTGLLVATGAFIGLMLLPLVFPYWIFGLLIFLNGVGSGLFASPNTSAIMSSVPAHYRGSASGMRSTFQNSGMSLSIGIFFSLMVAGLAATLPRTLTAGLRSQGVPLDIATKVAHIPPVSTMFAALLGYNPIHNLLDPTGVLSKLPAHNVAVLTGKQFFPTIISAPFHHGLVIVFTAAAIMSFVGALVSLLRGKQFYWEESAAGKTTAADAAAPGAYPSRTKANGSTAGTANANGPAAGRITAGTANVNGPAAGGSAGDSASTNGSTASGTTAHAGPGRATEGNGLVNGLAPDQLTGGAQGNGETGGPEARPSHGARG